MDRSLGLLKLFVVVAGILIVLGTAVLTWLLVTRSESPSAPPAGVIAVPVPSQGEFRGDLPMPEGAVVIDMQLGAGGALLLLRTTEGVEYLSLVEPATGRRISLLRLTPERP